MNQLKGRLKAETGADVLKKISSNNFGVKKDVQNLLAIRRLATQKRRTPALEFSRRISEKLLASGEPLMAYDTVAAALRDHPADVRLRQLQGLALARSGALEHASTVLDQLRREGNADEETLGMLARTYKDRAELAIDAPTAREFLSHAARIYADSFRRGGCFWSGINAATTALLMGKPRSASILAKKVHSICLREMKRSPKKDRYWVLATLGEAALISAEWAQAREWYTRARAIGLGRWGDLRSTRRNARMILKHWNVDASDFEGLWSIPPLLVFSGHMIDRKNRTSSRFPPVLESGVARELQRRIKSMGPIIGYASAAAGSDILFLESILQSGGKIVIVLPFPEKVFVRESVELRPRSNWRRRFEQVMDRASRVIIASSDRFGSDALPYDFANELLLGLANLKAKQLGAELKAMAVWDGARGDGPAGTWSVVRRWRASNIPIQIINPNSLGNDSASLRPQKISSPVATRTRVLHGHDLIRSDVLPILFADTVGFSKLGEHQIPQFVHGFLGAIGKTISQAAGEIVAKNTWGDGVYLVFTDLAAAANCAMKLSELVTTTRWEKFGLPKGMSLRLALHAGPVYGFQDPVTGQRTYTGSHVNRTARMEAITPPGQVYASEEFAALASGRKVNLHFEYVGQTPLAKNFGVMPMYSLRS